VTAKRRAIWSSVASVLWLLAAGASAQGPDRPGGGRNGNGGGPGPQRMMAPEQRPMASRDEAAPAGGSRLSPEERRQLRRDVHEAGRDIYPDRMPPGRREPRRQ
jgi:hypothetical protein